jgi:1-acyl-sn-glycerol-3-phosphate acyltransferase
MSTQPRRLKRSPGRPRLVRGGDGTQLAARRPARVLRRVRAVRRGLTVVGWTGLAALIQSVLLAVPGRGRVVFARFYWATVCRLIGLRVRAIGAPVPASGGRRVLFVSNHSSWLDIPVLGGRLDACFVAKSDVGAWPVIGTVARLGRTIFVSRKASATGRERDDMRERLASGDNLVLFPEGTTSDGSRVLPFRSAFFAIAEGGEPPLIQPVSVVYDRLAGLPTGRACRPLFAWYGDMDIASHFWRLAQHRDLRATVLLHAPIDPAAYANRKELSAQVWRVVADGAAALRQNRAVRPADGAAEGTTGGAAAGAPAGGSVLATS